LIQGEINPPYIKYCINREKWEEAKTLLNNFLKEERTEITLNIKKSNSHVKA
jgi:hypothetical protein